MIQPRNTAVVLRLIETSAEKKKGAIITLTNRELYSEAEVIAVGPGNIAAAGGVSETGDLKIGQKVFVKSKEMVRSPVGGGPTPQIAGIPFEENGTTYHIFEQMSILGILGLYNPAEDLTIN